MPSVSHTTVIRTQCSITPLSFSIIHCLNVISLSHPRLSIKRNTLSNFITHTGQVVIGLFATCHTTRVDHQVLLNSGWVRILLGLLRLNQNLIGVDHIYGPYVEDGLIKVALTPSGPMNSSGISCHTCPAPPTHLTDINIKINCGRKLEPREGDMPVLNPFFAESLFSDVKETWAKVVDGLIKYHFIRRYPYIFGSWKKDFAAEQPLYRSMARSLSEMFLRSPNRDFTRKGKAIFESLRKKRSAQINRAWEELGNLKTQSNAPAIPLEELEELREQTVTIGESEREEASTEEEFVNAVCAALIALYVREVKPRGKDLHTQALDDLNDYPLHQLEGGDRHGSQTGVASVSMIMFEDTSFQRMMGDSSLVPEALAGESSQHSSMSEESLGPITCQSSLENPVCVGTSSSQMSGIQLEMMERAQLEDRTSTIRTEPDNTSTKTFIHNRSASELGLEPMSEMDSPMVLAPHTSSSLPPESSVYSYASCVSGDEMMVDGAGAEVVMELESLGAASGGYDIEIDGVYGWERHVGHPDGAKGLKE
ncbi:hypothetical protein FRB94_001064 [Tulasnella sp. JGI-2019a]|nr:hypothetical protein FRB93_009039 [Tulasnella sp. JGI-2019a]KAG8988115.1 hypothetical protein FRB94_001064 [Tulasnella sp. JGI-2019a]